MELKADTSEALDKWLGLDTWFKTHPSDMGRFYNFVDQYQKDHGYSFDEAALHEEIEHRVGRGGGVGEELRDIIRNRISLAYDILGFLKQTGR